MWLPKKIQLNVLDSIADELTLATIDENWKIRVGRQTELRQKFNAPDLTIRFMGHFQIINLEGHEITMGSLATDEQIAAEIAKVRQPPVSMSMFVNRADFDAARKQMPTIAEQLKAARAKLAEARDGATNAIAKSDDASRVVLGEVNKVLKEAEDLRAEVAELTNGGPEL